MRVGDDGGDELGGPGREHLILSRLLAGRPSCPRKALELLVELVIPQTNSKPSSKVTTTWISFDRKRMEKMDHGMEDNV